MTEVVKNITPFITLLGLPLGLVILFDHIFTKGVKGHYFDFLKSLLRSVRRPFSIHFYFSIFIVSLLLTVMLLISSGAIETFEQKENSFAIAFKSFGPLITGVAIKIFIADWIIAAKTATIILVYHHRIILKNKSVARSLLSFALAVDIVLSALLIQMVIGRASDWQHNKLEEIHREIQLKRQEEEDSKEPKKKKQQELLDNFRGLRDTSVGNHKVILPIPIVIPNPKTSFREQLHDTFIDIFDELSFSLQNLYQSAFYFLNGSIFVLVASTVLFLLKRFESAFSIEGIKDKIFTITATFIGLIFLSIVITYRIFVG